MPKILLVDDEEDYLAISSKVLSRKEFTICAVSNGDEVLPAVSDFEPDVIILDVKLGAHDGRELCREIRDRFGEKNIRIILHSAYSSVGKDYHVYGADEFMVKPYAFTQLVDRIRFHLKEKGMQ